MSESAPKSIEIRGVTVTVGDFIRVHFTTKDIEAPQADEGEVIDIEYGAGGFVTVAGRTGERVLPVKNIAGVEKLPGKPKAN